MSEVHVRPHGWHRADYILRGEYCPLDEVQTRLTQVRVSAQATILVHIALDHEVVLRSLAWADGEPALDIAALRDKLRNADYRHMNKPVNALFVDAVRTLVTQTCASLPQATSDHIIQALLGIKARDARNITSTGLGIPSRQWGGVVLNHTGRDGVAPRDGEVRSVLLFYPGPSAEAADGSLLKDLGVLLKCTFEANTRRDVVVMNQVAQRLEAVPDGTKPVIETAAADALALAVEITGSTAGAVYIISTSGGLIFRRVSQLACPDGGLPDRRSQSAGPEGGFPDRIPVNSHTTVGWSVAQHRAYQHTGAGGSTRPLERAVRAEGGTELVTPIAGPLANTWAPAIGAIVLYAENPAFGYGAYERSLVRNVALRLALMRTNIATRDIATAISALRRGSPRLLQTQATAGDVRTAALPRDVDLAVRSFAQPFERLADSTQSHSVSLKIALPQDHGAVHGLALVRVAAYPPARLDDPFVIQKEGDPGPHWDVMRTGEEAHIADTTTDGRFAESRAGTKSALCVPVRVEGVVAGTLHLESPLQDNYTAFLPLVAALTGAIGRTLADARAEFEGRILDKAAHALARRHEFGGDLNSLTRDIRALEARTSTDPLITKVDAMLSVIQDLREAEPGPEFGAATVWDIFNECRRETQLRFGELARPADRLFHETVSPRAAQSLTTVLRSLFRNINYHSSTEAFDDAGRPIPRATFARTTLGGSCQALVILENHSRKYLDPHFCEELYRYPVEGAEKDLRLGTYIAGLNARRTTARIYATALDDLRTFRTTIAIPVEELQ